MKHMDGQPRASVVQTHRGSWGLCFLLLVLTMLLGVTPVVDAGATARNFDVTFEDCTEFVGLEPVSFADAQAVVPSEFSIVNADGFALFVVRISSCDAIGIDGSAPTPGTVAQIGINISPPDGQGNINNYTLTYASDVNVLVNGLRASGLPAQHNADLIYTFTRYSSTTSNLIGIVTPSPGPRWYVYGQASDPEPNSAFPFRAIWWYADSNHRVRMDTILPAIAFGDAEVSFQTPDTSILTALIGGNTIATISGLSVRGVFDHAEMAVSQ